MKEEYAEFFHGNKQEIENEKQKKRELMSYFPKTLGTIDETKYVLWDENKTSLVNPFENKEQENFKAITLSSLNKENKQVPTTFENSTENSTLLKPEKEKNETFAPKSAFDFNLTEATNTPFSTHALHKGPKMNYGNKKHTTDVESDSLGLERKNIENKLDSIAYNDKGHMSVTFRNDVIGIDGFKPFDPTDKAGCKRRCMEMLAYSGCELSGERIDMTINNERGRATSHSSDFQKGLNAINKALDKKQTIILNVDYKEGTASSADRAGDHFIIVVGRTIIDGVSYYHFYDPATQFTNFGTANTNVLYVKDGFLQGNFVKRNGSINNYKVTSARLNK